MINVKAYRSNNFKRKTNKAYIVPIDSIHEYAVWESSDNINKIIERKVKYYTNDNSYENIGEIKYVYDNFFDYNNPIILDYFNSMINDFCETKSIDEMNSYDIQL